MFIQFEKIRGNATARGNGSNAPAAPYTNAAHASFLPARASFKLAKFAQAVLDVIAASYWLLYIMLWITVILGILPFTLFCLFLIQF